jgi:hypothetical protein
MLDVQVGEGVWEVRRVDGLLNSPVHFTRGPRSLTRRILGLCRVECGKLTGTLHSTIPHPGCSWRVPLTGSSRSFYGPCE